MPRRLYEDDKIDERPARWPIAAILLAALVVRLVGIGYGLPYSFNLEEEANAKQAFKYTALYKWNKMKPDDPGRSNLTSYILAGEYGAYYAGANLVGRVGGIMEYRYRFLARPRAFYILARLASAVIGLFCIWGIYRICVIAFDWGVGVLAAFFMAFSPHNIHFSQVGVGDILAAAFLIGGLYHLVMLCVEKRIASAVAAGALLGLAAGAAFEYSVFVILFYVAYLVVVPREYKPSATLAGLGIGTFCFLAGAALPNAVLIYYYPKEVGAGFLQAAISTISSPALVSSARAVSVLKEAVAFDVFGWAIGWAFAVTGFLGLLWGMAFAKWKRRRFFVIFTALVVAGVFFFPTSRDGFIRWAFLMTPALAVGAGFFVYRLFWRKGVPATVAIVLMVVFTAGIAAQGALEVGSFALRKSENDTRWQFASWAMKNLPDGASVLATPQARFLLRKADLVGQDARWVDWRQKVLAAWNNRAFRVTLVGTRSGSEEIPGPKALVKDYDYVAVDTWTLEDLAPSLSPPLTDAELAQGYAAGGPGQRSLPALAAFVRSAGRGEKVIDIAAPPRGLAGYGPGIEVIKLTPPTSVERGPAAPR